MRKSVTLIILVILLLSFTFVSGSAESLYARPGDEGDLVMTLQQVLADKGYFSVTPTGYYGAITEAAVKAYQKDNGLARDGIAGPITLDSLNITGPAVISGETLYVGDENADVKTLQQTLKNKGYFNVDVTGYYGYVTESAVIKFQKDNGLTPDGIAGPKTFAALGMTASSAATNIAPIVKIRAISSIREKEDWVLRGDEGPDVEPIQKRLEELGYYTYYKTTNYFGTITETAVKEFQARNGLVVSGIVGEPTRDILFSSKAIPAKKTSSSNNSSSSSSSNSSSNSGSSSSSNSSNSSSSNSGGTVNYNKTTADQLIDYAKQFLGRPYVYGANGPNSFDCTGFTCYVYKKFGVTNLPRSAYSQGYTNYGIKINSISSLKKGDLVFFNTIDDSDISDHVGIYISDGKFIHASSSTKNGVQVCISTLSSGYYNRVFSWARRVL